jgi:4-carboxymuconolactone decarboxylase
MAMARLPEVREKHQLPEEHHKIIDYLVQTRGAVSNGFSVLLNSPELAGRIAHLGSYVRFESVLDNRTRELAALTASTEMGNGYEQAIHARALLDLGLPDATVEAIKAGADLNGVAADVALPVRCARELLRDHRLSDDAFAAAHASLGDRGTVELVANIGYYSMLACLHVAFEVK